MERSVREVFGQVEIVEPVAMGVASPAVLALVRARLRAAAEFELARQRCRAERAAGASLREIAAGLTRDGIPTRHGCAVWWPATVQAALRGSARQ